MPTDNMVEDVDMDTDLENEELEEDEDSEEVEEDDSDTDSDSDDDSSDDLVSEDVVGSVSLTDTAPAVERPPRRYFIEHKQARVNIITSVLNANKNASHASISQAIVDANELVPSNIASEISEVKKSLGVGRKEKAVAAAPASAVRLSKGGISAIKKLALSVKDKGYTSIEITLSGGKVDYRLSK